MAIGKGAQYIIGKQCVQSVVVSIPDCVNCLDEPAFFQVLIKQEHITEGYDEVRTHRIFRFPLLFGFRIISWDTGKRICFYIIGEYSALPALEYSALFVENPAKVQRLIFGDGITITDGMDYHGILNSVFELIVDIHKKPPCRITKKYFYNISIYANFVNLQLSKNPVYIRILYDSKWNYCQK